MPDTTTFGLFVPAALALLLVPGPAVLYVVTRSMDQGRLVGLVSVLGIGLGTLVHVAFAAVGLSALLASSAAAFSVVKWLGAAYLLWLGLRRLFARDDDEEPIVAEPEQLSRVFLQGVLVNVLNPKTALFFLAFLPQFVDRDQGSVGFQLLALGIAFAAVGLVVDTAIGIASGRLGRRLAASERVSRALDRLAAVVFIGLAVRLVTDR